MAKGVVKDDNRIPQLLQTLKLMRRRQVLVGIHSNATLAVIAAANEFGTQTKRGEEHVPERPFLRTAFDAKKNQDKVMRTLRQIFLLQKGKGARRGHVRNMLDAAGLAMSSAIRRNIRSNIPPANDPKTIKRKKSRRTLIDQGTLLGAVTHKVK